MGKKRSPEAVLSTWQLRRDRWNAKYHEDRAVLIAQLGGCCKQCEATEQLEFHHTEPRTWCARDHNRRQRLKLYLIDMQNGSIELLCKRCNRAAGTPTEPYEPDPDFEPEF